MISEDYVSFETAKLLKENGFDEITFTWYTGKGKFCVGKNTYDDYHMNHQSNFVSGWDKKKCSAPTLQMAMKWLREVHNIHISIDIHWLHFVNQNGWMYTITRILENGIEYVDSKGDENDKHFYSTYEEACEAAIKLSLARFLQYTSHNNIV